LPGAKPVVSGPAAPACTPPSTATPAWPTPKRCPMRRPGPRCPMRRPGPRSGSFTAHGRSSPATASPTSPHRHRQRRLVTARTNFATVLRGARVRQAGRPAPPSNPSRCGRAAAGAEQTCSAPPWRAGWCGRSTGAAEVFGATAPGAGVALDECGPLGGDENSAATVHDRTRSTRRSARSECHRPWTGCVPSETSPAGSVRACADVGGLEQRRNRRGHRIGFPSKFWAGPLPIHVTIKKRSRLPASELGSEKGVTHGAET
jgi:hypothetical protein